MEVDVVLGKGTLHGHMQIPERVVTSHLKAAPDQRLDVLELNADLEDGGCHTRLYSFRRSGPKASVPDLSQFRPRGNWRAPVSMHRSRGYKTDSIGEKRFGFVTPSNCRAVLISQVTRKRALLASSRTKASFHTVSPRPALPAASPHAPARAAPGLPLGPGNLSATQPRLGQSRRASDR